jgi:hypothetical protein
VGLQVEGEGVSRNVADLVVLAMSITMALLVGTLIGATTEASTTDGLVIGFGSQILVILVRRG